MFFINPKKHLSSHTFVLHLLPAGAVLLTFLVLTLIGWSNARHTLNNEKQVVTSDFATNTQNKITDRLKTYEVVLKGASGLFLASDSVTAGEWKNFVASFQLQEKYPGIQSVGYVELVQPDRVAAVTEEQRKTYPDFRIFPDGSRSLYSAVLYIEPQRSTTGLGYDMYAEPNRRSAMDRAWQTGTASLTGQLNFVQSPSQLSAKSGFTMYIPVYEKTMQPSTPPAQRPIKGFAYAPFVNPTLFNGMLGEKQDEKYAVRIQDITDQSNVTTLYKTTNFDTLETNNSYHKSTTSELYGRQWRMDFRVSPAVISSSTRNRPTNSLISGTFLGLLLSGLVLTLLMARTRALAHTKQLEIQDAKDELLSLASHQLRTPATSVKQYIGMIREGFAGKLSPQQKSLLDKAYESNERQLHIINELLYVAKVDANGIVLTPRKLSVPAMLRDMSQELSSIAHQRKNRIKLEVPKRAVTVEADEHCLRMALENLLNNAIKYSFEGSVVTIKLINKKDSVEISIRNRGIGIDPDDIHLLFQRFTRIPNELSKQVSGSGIGLYLAQQLINLHGGEITVESTPGKATTFTVHIPKTLNITTNRV